MKTALQILKERFDSGLWFHKDEADQMIDELLATERSYIEHAFAMGYGAGAAGSTITPQQYYDEMYNDNAAID